MGGPGSGRARQLTDIDACHCLEIGELVDGGRWRKKPRGRILWRSARSGIVLAQLSFAITEAEAHPDGSRALVCRFAYRPHLGSSASEGRLLLCGAQGRRMLATCPTCGKGVRRLYLPPGEPRFGCRDCHRLAYRRVPFAETLRRVRQVMGTILEGLDESEPAVSYPPPPADADLEALLASCGLGAPLGREELRLAALHLRRAGLSYRRIAAELEISKSGIARIVAAGLEGIDLDRLCAERYWRFSDLDPIPLDRGTARQQLLALRRWEKRHGLHRRVAEPEVREMLGESLEP